MWCKGGSTDKQMRRLGYRTLEEAGAENNQLSLSRLPTNQSGFQQLSVTRVAESTLDERRAYEKLGRDSDALQRLSVELGRLKGELEQGVLPNAIHRKLLDTERKLDRMKQHCSIPLQHDAVLRRLERVRKAVEKIVCSQAK